MKLPFLAQATLFASLLASCEQTNTNTQVDSEAVEQSTLRDVRRSEAKADFTQILSSVDALYAPLRRKQ
jgi:hypothetical protein